MAKWTGEIYQVFEAVANAKDGEVPCMGIRFAKDVSAEEIVDFVNRSTTMTLNEKEAALAEAKRRKKQIPTTDTLKS